MKNIYTIEDRENNQKIHNQKIDFAHNYICPLDDMQLQAISHIAYRANRHCYARRKYNNWEYFRGVIHAIGAILDIDIDTSREILHAVQRIQRNYNKASMRDNYRSYLACLNDPITDRMQDILWDILTR